MCYFIMDYKIIKFHIICMMNNIHLQPTTMLSLYQIKSKIICFMIQHIFAQQIKNLQNFLNLF